jgi:hypothetical protein
MSGSQQQQLSVDEAADRLLAMRGQEENSYAYHLYFPASVGETDRRVNVSWREKIVTWSYNVIDQ